MSKTKIESSFGRRVLRGLLWILAIVAVYYGLNAALRTAPNAPLQVFAHRGGRAEQPENTLAAFRNAIALGADWIEFDVQMTRDGALIVMHDDTVDRTTNGTGRVADLTLDEIRKLDAGNGERVPTFQEVIDLAKASGANIFPEAKSAHLYPGMEEKMLKTLDDSNYLDHAIIQSFEPASLATLHRLNPKARLCALYGLWQFSITSPTGDAHYVCPMAEMAILDPFMIRQGHQDGRSVIVWFGALKNPFWFRVMQFFGADGIITDDPRLLLHALGR